MNVKVTDYVVLFKESFLSLTDHKIIESFPKKVIFTCKSPNFSIQKGTFRHNPFFVFPLLAEILSEV